ncbi:solute carrier family 35 member F6-like [Oppia nitens]|uniref:solute carrier family 35 member F6-like n=1 Tax=Oppia nitens TaxID=1686743 RepID=UPI0023DA1B36|nr:solute carrier family 35 member F6-like [Oppia nitens]
MAWTKYQIFLAVLLVITGTINTLATKWADITPSRGRDGVIREFNHPFLQAVAMFLGELTCLLAYKLLYYYYIKKDYVDDELPEFVKGSRDFNPLIFLPPALCDMTATSLMYIGLNLTYASSFQMLRGAIIIFTGLLSVFFLKRRLKLYEWAGMVVVIVGLAIVGTGDFVFSNASQSGKSTSNIIIGDVIIIVGQVIAASQMVVEEKFVASSNVSPLQAVGWEGLFGAVILSFLLIPMYWIPTGNTIFNNPYGNMEDAIDGFYQIGNQWQVALGLVGTIISISFFNFAGISVTKQMSATTRTVLDSVRTFVIWIFSLAIGWEIPGNRTYIQVAGFIVLLLGMFVYNDVLVRPMLIKIGCLKGDDNKNAALDTNPVASAPVADGTDGNTKRGQDVETNNW